MRLLAGSLALLLALPAWADGGSLALGGGSARRSYKPPVLDGVSTAPTGAYSFRRLLTSYTANKAVNIVRASDSALSDVGFLTTGAFDTATAAAFCAATTCKVVTWYDQTAATAHDLTQATDANRYALVFDCLGSLACMQATAATQVLQSATNVTPATGVASFSAVAARAAGTANCTLLRQNGINNRFAMISGAQQWNIIGGTSGSVVGTALNPSWHASSAVLNGASSVIAIDGTEVTGTATGNTTAGTPLIAGIASTTCNQTEAIVWDNYVLTATERAYLNTNQHAYWGF